MNKARFNINRVLRRFARQERGAILAELAIVLPIMLLLFVGTAEFGLYFYNYSTLSKATRVGVRYISAKSYNDDNIAIAKNLVVCGVESAAIDACETGSEVISGISGDNVEVSIVSGSSLLPTEVRVEIVNFNYQPIFDLGEFTGGDPWLDVPVAPSTTMRYTLTD
ncbi:MAG: TadE/TadG family type IV pilus assembly protein [Pyrinomonadaceae bacterium]